MTVKIANAIPVRVARWLTFLGYKFVCEDGQVKKVYKHGNRLVS